MRNIKFFIVFVAIATLSPIILAKLGFWDSSHASPKFQASNVPSTPLSNADAIARATPAVVSIHSTKEIAKDTNPVVRDPFFRYFFGDMRNQVPPEVQSGIGSGVIVTKDGYILTNDHVIKEADQINIKLPDGRVTKAKVIGSDPDTDLAILKIDLPELAVISMGNSETLRVGDMVFAIGNPFGVGQTVTHGIVSATHRTDLGISTFENFIQTDAAINPGNSGGALIDINGNLIGINNAIYTRNGGFQGIGFAIPVNLAKDVMSELIDQGHITRGWLGVTVSKLTDEVRKSINYPKGNGAVIAGMIRNGPAHIAGLRPGDIIISVDNKPTPDASDVLSITAKLKPDTAYPITIIRNNETLDFRVVIGKRPVKTTAEKAVGENYKAGNANNNGNNPINPAMPNNPTNPN
jgi:Do/DeqQ family serine protease